ncbi:DUF3139 domain-containing protein [Amphibacillus cookii]|uniref:DUF3139 domain-containing protein n=1 Tax=Amphibacillus cookii TaxID=767787 RepID=UPI0019587FB7|nr:DUF3139 domain-containing protein [Amphibacillus cookii]MBM7540123.1 hypothetical protein [Amphibacillus cookii]
MKRKIISIPILIIIILVGSFFGFIELKKNSLKNTVVEYLITEENISENEIISSEPFISNLKGNKNYMVSIKLKNDAKTYYYYQNEDNKIILESYTEDGEEHVVDK